MPLGYTRSSSTAVVSPVGYMDGYNDVNTRLEYPEMYAVRRSTSVPEILSRPYYLGRAYTPDAYRYYRDWPLFGGTFSYDRRRLTHDSVYQPYYAPVYHRGPVQWPSSESSADPGIWSPHTRWEYPSSSSSSSSGGYRHLYPSIYDSRAYGLHWGPYWRWKRLQWPWIDDPAAPEAEGALKAYKQRLICRDSYLKDYWLSPYSWELRYSGYRNAYNPHTPYAAYRPHYYYHYMKY